MELTFPPREKLGVFPTPLHQAPRLGALLGLDEVWLKRDDLTGFSWGGNKVRTIEFLLADALDRGASDLVVSGGPTSNFAAIVSRAGQCAGMRVHHVSYGSEPSSSPPALAASRQAGAVVRFTGSPDRPHMDVAAHQLARELEAGGRVPIVIPRGGATPLGAVGFVAAAVELHEQCKFLSGNGPSGNGPALDEATIVVPVGSGGSIAGLLAGMAAIGARWSLVGASVSRSAAAMADELLTKARHTAALVGCEVERAALASPLHLVDCRGEGFGMASSAERRLADRVASATGLLIDATYNAKALHWLATNAAAMRGPVIYWHTGGALGSLPATKPTKDEPG